LRQQRARVDGDPARGVGDARIAQKRGRPVGRNPNKQVVLKRLVVLEAHRPALRIDCRQGM
jgi:hypothetical protein